MNVYLEHIVVYVDISIDLMKHHKKVSPKLDIAIRIDIKEIKGDG